MIVKYRNQQLKSQFKQACSIIWQTTDKIKMYDNPNIYEYALSANSIVPVFKKYIHVQDNFTAKRLQHTHTNYTGIAIPSSSDIFDYPIQTTSGSTILFWNRTTKNVTTYELVIAVDVNGINKKPNRYGYDTFGFKICPDNSVVALGAPRPQNCYGQNSMKVCNLSDNSAYSGLGCTAAAIKDDSYFDNLP